jgi:hypothetical protein
MRKKVAIAVSCVFALVIQAFATTSNDGTGRNETDRYFVRRVLEVQDLLLSKDVDQTAFTFEFTSGDYIQVACEGCAEWLDRAERGYVSLQLMSAAGNTELHKADLGQWVAVPDAGGRIALVFKRDGVGERYLHLESLSILRKTQSAAVAVAGKPVGLVAVNQLCLPRLQPGATNHPTRFFLPFKGQDQYKVQVTGGHGATPVVGYVFKTGEEFAKQPIAYGQAVTVPTTDALSTQFGFEFAEATATKGAYFYHIDIDRIPARNAGEPSPQDR